MLAQQPAPALLVHSDHSGQYRANAYRALLGQHQGLRSQSSRGLDNAQAESLWSRLKTEELGPREWPVFRDLTDVQQRVATYFDYYNHARRHSALAYQTPQAFYLQQLKNTTRNSFAYLDPLSGPPPPPVPGWQPAAQQAFTRHAGRYSTRRLRAELIALLKNAKYAC